MSSRMTLWMKCLPVPWSLGFGAATLGLWLHSFRPLPPGPIKWIMLIVWIGGTAAMRPQIRLKRVRIDGRNPLISNYIREISVPIDNIVDVTEIRWINIHPVTIHLREATGFGRKISFMPKMYLLHWDDSHPVVVDLKYLARLKE